MRTIEMGEPIRIDRRRLEAIAADCQINVEPTDIQTLAGIVLAIVDRLEADKDE
jgi:hypothetical protein